MQGVFCFLMFILGACIGSFLCCMARRLRLKETKKPLKSKRSICLHCRYQLKWYDNIPIISWLVLRGKCRKCGKKIGLMEFLSEISLAFGFLAIATTINISTTSILDWCIFVATILLIIPLGFLAIYDGKWGELPNFAIIISIIIALILSALEQTEIYLAEGFSFTPIINVAASVTVLGGVYFVLHVVSKGRWVGDGDWLLGFAIGLALADPWLALVALFTANLLACVIMAPIIKKTKNKTIHFGPFLVLAFVITLAIKCVIIIL